MSKLYRKWYSFDMSYYDDIYEAAVDRHYLFTTADARTLGIPGIELVKLARRGRLESLGNGVYRLARYVPMDSDPYAVAVARAGAGAFLWGESVVALLGLAPTNPDRIFVATKRRVRRSLPEGIVLVRAPYNETPTVYEGVASQLVSHAISACRSTIMPGRLRQAIERARAEGYITSDELDNLMGSWDGGKEAQQQAKSRHGNTQAWGG